MLQSLQDWNEVWNGNGILREDSSSRHPEEDAVMPEIEKSIHHGGFLVVVVAVIVCLLVCFCFVFLFFVIISLAAFWSVTAPPPPPNHHHHPNPTLSAMAILQVFVFFFSTSSPVSFLLAPSSDVFHFCCEWFKVLRNSFIDWWFLA